MRLLLDFTRAHPWHSLLMIVCLLVAAAAEAIALSSLLPLLSAVSGQSTMGGVLPGAPGGLELAFTDAMRSFGLEPTAGVLLVLVPMAFCVRGGIVLLARREIGYTVARVARELRIRLIRALLAARWSYFVGERLGTFANAYSSETTRATKGYLNATWVIMLGMQVVVYVGVALAISWRFTLAAAVVGAFMVLVLGPLVRVGRRAGFKQTKASRGVMGTLADVLQGVKALKAMALEARVSPLLEDGTRRMEKAMRKEVFSREAIAALQEPIMTSILCLGIFAMGRMNFNIASMGVMVLLVSRTIDALNRAQRRYLRAAVQASAYDSLLQTIESAETARERPPEGAPPTFEEVVSFRSVRFRYGDELLFDDLSLEIPAGRITALTGTSGAGKTTIVDLVVGLVNPDGGELLIDGRPLAEIDLTVWRRHVGYVPQEMFLLNDTIAMNVALGDAEVSREAIVRALQDAHAWEFVSRMPNGIDTVVGERGSALSGGQRQRIAIARALLHQPWLLVLDEATTSLDPASETAVWEALQGLRGRTAVLAISHQQALLDAADRVYWISGGRAREVAVGATGNHEAVGTAGPLSGAAIASAGTGARMR